jgi:hypothetical protein
LDTGRLSSPGAQALPTFAEFLLQSGKKFELPQPTQFAEISCDA